MLALGLFVAVTSFFAKEHAADMFGTGVWWLLTGLFIIRRSVYGIISFYLVVAEAYYSLFVGGVAIEPLLRVGIVIWLTIPATLYFPWMEWEKEDQPKVVARKMPELPDSLPDGSPVKAEVTDEQIRTVWDHIKQQRERRRGDD